MVLVILALYLISAKQFDIWAESMHWTLRFKDFNMVWIAIAALSLMSAINSSEIFRAHLRQSKRAVRCSQIDRHDELTSHPSCAAPASLADFIAHVQ